MIIQSILIILTLLSTFIVAVYNNPEALMASIQCVLLISTNLLFVLLPFTAMMALLSAAVRSPLLAIILAVLVWTLVSFALTSISQHWPIFEFLTYLIPGVHLDNLTELQPSETLSLAYIPALQTLVLLVIGRFVMARSSV